jgi:hypothetical protein
MSGPCRRATGPLGRSHYKALGTFHKIAGPACFADADHTAFPPLLPPKRLTVLGGSSVPTHQTAASK